MAAALRLATPTRPRCMTTGRCPLHAAVVANRDVSCHRPSVEPTPFALTPTQKGILATLSRATGKSTHALLDETLKVLQEREQADHAPGPTDDRTTAAPDAASPE